MLSRMSTLRLVTSRVALMKCAIRAFTVAPASDPLELMRATFVKRGMCDESGFRMPGVHWTMSLAFGADDPMKVGRNACYSFGVIVKHMILTTRMFCFSFLHQ